MARNTTAPQVLSGTISSSSDVNFHSEGTRQFGDGQDTQITHALTWRLTLISLKDFDVTGDLDYRLEPNGYAYGHAHFCVGRRG